MGCFLDVDWEELRSECFRPLAGCGLFHKLLEDMPEEERFPSPCGVWVVSLSASLRVAASARFRPLAGCGLFPCIYTGLPDGRKGFRPLAGCGLFPEVYGAKTMDACFRPLAGCGLFLTMDMGWRLYYLFPSPCGVWVVSQQAYPIFRALGFRPLAGCGLFRQSCTFFLVQQEKELSTLLFYCIILADVYQ